MLESFFSASYSEARQRFRNAATSLGADLHSYVVCTEPEDLTMDVATLGSETAPALVISSGVHGVEGFAGSAIQLAVLDHLSQMESRPELRYVLIHSINPHGFYHLRRWNENNVDLNRNFLTTDDYSGAPPGYVTLNAFLNPESPPSRFEPFTLKALWKIFRDGLPTLKEAVATGQYEYPRGLFFGGKARSKSAQLMRDHCDSWLAQSQRAVHVDLHTGLGPFGTYRLLLGDTENPDHVPWYVANFDQEHVEAMSSEGTAYPASGLYLDWMMQHFSSRDYRAVGAEFGTYGVIRVLGALRAENRAHYYAEPESSALRRAREELVECFAPASPVWRRTIVESGLKIVNQATQALLNPDGFSGGSDADVS